MESPRLLGGGGGGNDDDNGGTDGNGNNGNGNTILSREEASRIIDLVKEERMAEMRDLGKGASCLVF